MGPQLNSAAPLQSLPQFRTAEATAGATMRVADFVPCDGTPSRLQSASYVGNDRKAAERVRVIIRCRPLNEKEQAEGSEVVVHVDSPSATVTLCRTDGKSCGSEKRFTFDAAYSWNAEQKHIYDETAVGIVESVMEGYNGTIFAYGQTGTGKTHTMMGTESCHVNKGIIPRAFEHIFSRVACSTRTRYLVQASFLEIYNEEIRDLLAKNPTGRLELKDHPRSGVYVKDLSSFVVKGVEELQAAMLAGQKNRKVGATLMNVVSSRSHTIFTVTIESCESVDGEDSQIRVGKLNLVDLAGSERHAKTGATGGTFKEAAKINLSLSALGNVISALVESRTNFIPYRDSKLTRLLQDSLGGNTKTAMIATIGPADSNYEETLSTLRYAHRAKNIRNKPRINSDPKDAVIRAFQEEIAKLKAELAYAATLPREIERVVEVEKKVLVEVEKKVVVPVEKEVLVERVVEKVVPGPPAEEELRRLERAVQEEKRLMYEDFEREKKQIEEARHIAEEEKASLMEELEARKKEQEAQREHQEELIARLKAMEGKIIEGSQVKQQAAKQEQELRRTQLELEKQRQKELQMKQDLEKHQLERLTLEEKFNSREEQIGCLTEKLEKLWRSFKTAMAEIEDLQHEFQAEREDLLDTIRQLTRELKRQGAIIDHFLPKDAVATIDEHLHWDENLEEWVLAKAELTGNVLYATEALREAHICSSCAEEMSTPRQRFSTGSAKIARTRRTPSFATSLDIPQTYLLSSVDRDFDAVDSERIKSAICTVLGADSSTDQAQAARRENIHLEYPSEANAFHGHSVSSCGRKICTQTTCAFRRYLELF
ncbi:kinesin motor domain-containing protein [Toxoplasma gondii ME49]|uniref:Kinesin-like protein n=2 Tax=Toxoplasma gondii TaxID=5811 RepID=A0A125YQ32_TOXGV|nr:kinesin motor domain-containing protein [Toxoplasma gondii ME49]EPT32445.1 kinesin motor domain-containing protein [Toxoplasma gondii ME49]ESS29389.1 kinesin motor domain-containing protein [Toxoplasma gondii VEG]|eukprot:XP_018638511.1 kinesin motor domain-containing protein [Toxoplasma gondii ME49]